MLGVCLLHCANGFAVSEIISEPIFISSTAQVSAIASNAAAIFLPQLNQNYSSLTTEYTWMIASVFTALMIIIAALVFVRAKSRKQALLLIMLLATMLAFEQWFETYISHRYQDDSRTATLQKLSVVRAKIESILNNNLSLLKGLAIVIAADPKLSKEKFNAYAQEIMRNESLLLNFTAAPDLVARYIYPMEGNESVLGLNFLSHPEQRKEVLEVRDSRRIIVAGPVDLVQGGRALIGRAPVFYFDDERQQERFWGIISAPMKIDLVMAEAGVYKLMTSQNVAVQKLKPRGQKPVAILGDQALFEGSAVTADVLIGREMWRLASEPKFNVHHLAQTLFFIRLVFSFLIFFVALILIVRMRQSRERKSFVDALKYREGMLEKVGTIAKVGGWEYHLGQGFVFVSAEVFNILKLDSRHGLPDEKGLYALICPERAKELKENIKAALFEQEDFDIELPLVLNGFGRKWVDIRAYASVNPEGVVVVVGVIQDISQRKNSEAIILKQANYDSLTQLPNRSLFDARLGFAVASAARSQERFALLQLDLDRFKSINDSLGHDVGDQLLVAVAKRFSACIRATDILSRRNGDEFTLIASQLSNNHAVGQVARNLLAQLKKPIVINEQQIYMTASIGITIYPEDGKEAVVLMKNADQAMHVAKSQGRNTFCYFTGTMQTEADRRLRLHMDLTQALDRQQLQVYYQPIVDMRTGQVVECEALARWFHPELGEISPDDFIPLAEDVGLINQLGDFITQTALANIKSINREHNLDIGLALNKSYREFFSSNEGERLAWFDQLLQQEDGPRVIVEITESMLMEDDTIYSMLDHLRQAGVKIAIDDFGTGYSSLSYLRRFPVDLLKIDRSFIRDIDTDREDLTLVEAILAMAKNLGLKVIAEGVESVEQMHLLESRQCDYAQGYYYGQPMSYKDFSLWLNEPEYALIES